MVRPCIQVRILLFQPDLTGSFLFAPLSLRTTGVTCYPCPLCAYAAERTECSDFPLLVTESCQQQPSDTGAIIC